MIGQFIQRSRTLFVDEKRHYVGVVNSGSSAAVAKMTSACRDAFA